MDEERQPVLVLYCVLCGYAQVIDMAARPIPCPNVSAHGLRCACKQFKQVPPEIIEPEPLDWSENDRRFLRSLRISAEDAPASSVRTRRR